MKILFSKNYLQKLYLLIIFFTVACQKNSEHWEYWKNFFDFQDGIKKNLQSEKKWQIANGNLDSQNENLLQKTKTQNLALLWNVVYANSKFQTKTISLTDAEEYPTNLENYLLVEYTPSIFHTTETYIFKRTLQYQSQSIYHTTEFLDWIRFFQTHPDPNTLLLDSSLGNFLCQTFDCSFNSNEKSFIQIFKPNQALKKLDKSFYKRITKLLNSKFEINFLENSNQFLKVSNQNQSLKFEWNKTPISQYPHKIQMQINFYTKFYGLEIQIQNWIYELEFGITGQSSYLKGRFKNIPQYSLKGRLGYILPKQVLNFFIPENIDEYMKTLFEMRLQGNKGKGNLWEINIKPHFKYYRITSVIESESPRKVFRFWSSENKQESQEIFEETFKKKLLESLNE